MAEETVGKMGNLGNLGNLLRVYLLREVIIPLEHTPYFNRVLSRFVAYRFPTFPRFPTTGAQNGKCRCEPRDFGCRGRHSERNHEGID